MRMRCSHAHTHNSVPGCKVVVIDDAACGKSKRAVAVGLAASVLQFASGTLIEAAEHPEATQFETSTLEIYRFSVVWLRKFARRQGKEAMRQGGNEAMRRCDNCAWRVPVDVQWCVYDYPAVRQQGCGR